MPIKTALTNVRLKADIFQEYLNVSISKPSASFPAPYRTSATGPISTNFPMSTLINGANYWDDFGGIASTVSASTGPYPTLLGYGTYSLNGSSTDFSLRYSRTILKTSASNLKMSDYRGSIRPYFGNIILSSYGTSTYTLGAGKFWLKMKLIGGGGGGGGGDGSRSVRFGGPGGGGSQVDMTFYVASSSASQAIKIYIGEGGAGGYTYDGTKNNFAYGLTRPAGGRGWRNGGRGGRCGRTGGSGYGGGGGGASAIEWYPNGTSSAGFLIAFAGGGGGGGGAGQYIGNLEAGNFYGVSSAVAGAYSIVSSLTYPRYDKAGNYAGVTNVDTSLNGHVTNRGETSDTNLLNDGFDAPSGDNFYSYYYKPYLQDVYGGDFTTAINNIYGSQTPAQIDSNFNFDSGGPGGGGAGYGAPGFFPPFVITSDIFVDAYGNITYPWAISFANGGETGGGGGGSGYSYRNNNIFASTYEFVWRNSYFNYGWPYGVYPTRGPVNANQQWGQNYTRGIGGSGGDGLYGRSSDGQKGNDGGIILGITNADHEGGLLNLVSI